MVRCVRTGSGSKGRCDGCVMPVREDEYARCTASLHNDHYVLQHQMYIMPARALARQGAVALLHVLSW